MQIKFNNYGIPIMTEEEHIALHKYLISIPCSSCGAKAGQRCKTVDSKSRKVHFARVSQDFDSAVWLEKYRKENS